MGPDHTETVHASESFEKLGLLAAHLAALHDAHMLERGLLPGTQLPDSEAPPIAPVLDEFPWKELKPVTLADMKVGKTHRRHVLQGRLCVTAYKIHSVVSVLEEDSGLATILMLKNSVPLRASMAQAQHCFPEGSRVAIRDPYLTRFPDGLVGVLVEHPTDIVFLSRPITPEDHWAFTSPKHSESVVHNSSNDTVSQSPDSTHKVASFLVNAGVTQQGDHHKQSSVIVDADMCKQDFHTDAKEVEIPFPQDNIVEPQGSAAEDVSTVRDLGAGTCQKDKDVGEVKEDFLPSKDLDEAAQSEPCHVNGDAVTGVPNADIVETQVVSHPAVEEIKDEGSERENVVEANESGLGDLNRATVGHSDTSNSAQAGKVVSRTVVADSPKISSSKSMVEATISEKYNVDSAIDFGNSYAKSLDDAADEVVGTTATKSYSAGDATKFQKGDGYREAVSGVLGGETNRSDETKEVVSSPVMEECNEILQSKNVDDGTEVDRCNEESEDLTGISKVEAERTDDVKQVVSISAAENFNELVQSTVVDEGTEDERCGEQIEDKPEASEMEEEKNNESKEVVSSLAVEECNEISPSTRVDEGTEDDRHGEEVEDITRVSEVEKKTNEVKDGVSSPATEDSNGLMPRTIVGEGYEDERFGDIIKDKVGASDMEAEMSDELKGVASNPLMEVCNEIMPSTSVDEGIEHVKHDEESEEKAGASEMETERCYELKGVVSSLGMEDCNEFMPSKSVDEGIEHVNHDEENEDEVGPSEMVAERSDDVKEVVSSLAMEECNESLPKTCMDAGTEVVRHDEESKDRPGVVEVEAEKNDEKIVPSIATKESDEFFSNLSVDEGARFDEESIAGVSVLQAEKSNVARETLSSPATEESNEIFSSTSVDEGTDNDRRDEGSEYIAGALEMEAATSHGVKEVVSSAAMECNEILPSTGEDEDVMHDEETEDIPVASEVGEAKSEESKEVVSRPVVQESSGTLSNNNLVETVELERCHLDRNTQTGAVNVETSKYEKTGEVPKPNCGEAQQEIDLSSMPKESFSAHALRLQGNKLFLHEDFHGATELYTRGILQAMKEQEHTRSATSPKKSGVTNGHASESEVLLGFSNRAEAWIRLHEYEKGLEDAEKALALQHDHLKSLFRKGRALLGLHQYHDANLILREAAPRAPSDKDLQAALHESIIHVQQSEMGLFDLSNFYLRGRYVGEFPSCTDYIGPVKVAEVGHGCGRGLVLKKHVEAGELLLVSNTIAFTEVQRFDYQTGVEVSEQSINRKVQEAFGPICANPHALGWDNQKLHTLFDGVKKLPTPPANLLTSNSRFSPVAMAPLDASCIHRIIQLNAFNGNATIGWKNLPGSGDQENKVENWGLWWLPSFINHSCMPNSSQILVGRALFVFASRELQAGEEITRGYFDIFQPHQQRKDLSTKGWGFVCHCPRCKLEDALHTPLSQVTNHYTKLMELAARPKPEKVSDAKHADNQATTALRFSHELERKLKDLKLRAVEENWIRGSFVHFIDLITSEHELSPHLELVVEAMAAVCPGSESTVHMSVLAKDSAKHTTGKKSVQFKSAHHRAMHICRCTYGKQKSSVLQALVDRDDH